MLRDSDADQCFTAWSVITPSKFAAAWHPVSPVGSETVSPIDPMLTPIGEALPQQRTVEAWCIVTLTSNPPSLGKTKEWPVESSGQMANCVKAYTDEDWLSA